MVAFTAVMWFGSKHLGKNEVSTFVTPFPFFGIFSLAKAGAVVQQVSS